MVANRLRASAPARANLIGNPSDLYAGAVLGCSVPLRARVELEPADGLELVAGSAHHRVRGPEDLTLRGDAFDVVRAVLADLDALPRVRIAYESDIPFGSGLAGSTALLVALLRALLAWSGVESGGHALAERARRVEQELLGIACGWVDHYLCTFGGLHFVDFHAKVSGDSEPARVEALPPSRQPLPFVLAFTGVSHHSGTVHAPIRERWRRGEPEVLAAYRRVTRIAHEARRAFAAADWDAFGVLMNENHAIQRGLGGSGPANERLIEAALEAGAPGAKLAGAGDGGTIVALWPAAETAPLDFALRAAGAAALYRPEPAPGVTLERS